MLHKDFRKSYNFVSIWDKVKIKVTVQRLLTRLLG